jgi:hypothetical protein
MSSLKTIPLGKLCDFANGGTPIAVLHADKSFVRLRDQVKEIASRLEEKSTIPMVKAQLELILDLQQDEYWADITLPMLENVHQKLRDLVKFLDKKQRNVIYSDFQDEISEVREVSPGWIVLGSTAGSLPPPPLQNRTCRFPFIRLLNVLVPVMNTLHIFRGNGFSVDVVVTIPV